MPKKGGCQIPRPITPPASSVIDTLPSREGREEYPNHPPDYSRPPAHIDPDTLEEARRVSETLGMPSYARAILARLDTIEKRLATLEGK